MPKEVLTPAFELAAKASKPFPNDSAAYRKARTDLLAEEIQLRRHIERVAEQRRALPPGGEVPQDYAFIAEDGRRVTLSELFGDKDTLVTYFWMFGPERARPCPMCTGFLGALDGNARDIRQRVALAVIGRSPIERQKAFKQERGWQGLPLYATTDESFARDYRGLVPRCPRQDGDGRGRGRRAERLPPGLPTARCATSGARRWASRPPTPARTRAARPIRW